MNATLENIFCKPRTGNERGLPKFPVPRAAITALGVEGDFNRYRHEKKADSPDMAVLLLPAEILDELVAEGWPVRPGDLGENLITRGIANASLGVGSRLRIGAVEIELTEAAEPCRTLFTLPYVGTENGSRFVQTLEGRRGWYARVTKPGEVAAGDVVEIVDETATASRYE